MTVNATAPPAEPWSGTMDVDEFMDFLETRPDGEHWELIEGVAVMMAPTTFEHQRIAQNLSHLLLSAFVARGLDLFAYIDVGIRTKGVRNFQPKPDVVVLPGVAGRNLYAENFQLVAEVLSPSNTRREIDMKLRQYREAPDNLYSLVIEPRAFLVEIYARRHNWEPTTLTRPDDPIEMPEFGLTCRVVDLYRGTLLDPQRGMAQVSSRD
jgi:Uma2 family endonuclease